MKELKYKAWWAGKFLKDELTRNRPFILCDLTRGYNHVCNKVETR